MSATAVKGVIDRVTSDGHLSVDDFNAITSREDGWFSAPVAIGTFLDQDEYDMISRVAQAVAEGRLAADSQAQWMLQAFIDRGPENRLTHALKGGGATAGFVGGGATVGGVLGLISTAAFPWFELGAFVGTIGMGAGIGAAFGYAGAFVQGLFDD